MANPSLDQVKTLHDPARLQEIADLDLASDEVDAILQDLARRAAECFDLPIGLVSMVLDQAQHFAAMQRIEARRPAR